MALTEAQLVTQLQNLININQPNSVIRIGTFNINRYAPRDAAGVKQAIRTVLETKLSLCGIQEFLNGPKFNGVALSKVTNMYMHCDSMTNQIRKYKDSDGVTRDYYYGNAITSYHTFYDVIGRKNYKAVGTHPDCEVRGYIRVQVALPNKKLWIYNTHLEAFDGEAMEAQMAELASDISAHKALHPNDYYVVMGDFNCSWDSGYNPLYNLGFKATFTTTELDNIFYSPNITLRTSGKVSPAVSDHPLSWAELKCN